MPIDLSVFFRLEEKDSSLTEICAKGMTSPISDADVKDLVDAAKDSLYLKSLILWDGDITSFGAKLIADNLQFLEKIDLSGNKIDYVGLVALCNMPQLKKLTLIGNNLPQVDLSVLQSNNNDLEIILSKNTNGKTIEPIVFTPTAKKRKITYSETTILTDIGLLYSKLLQKMDPNTTSEERGEFISEIQEQLTVTLKNVAIAQLEHPSNLPKPHP